MDRLTSLCAKILARLIEQKERYGTAACQCGKGRVVITWEELPQNGDELTGTQKRILEVLGTAPITVRAILREADYAPSSESTVRKALAELVRLGRVLHTPDGYSRVTE
jgi:hypothetical protein